MTYSFPQSADLTVALPQMWLKPSSTAVNSHTATSFSASAAAQRDLQFQQVPDNLLRNETFLADGAGLPHHCLTDSAILESS